MSNSKIFENIRNFCWNHRGKIAVGVACAVGIGTSLYYTLSNSNDDPSKNDVKENQTKPIRKGANLDDSKRTEILQRIRRENDTTMKYFLSTFRTKLNQIIEFASLIRQLKMLRENPPENNTLETDLWENIKVSAFSTLYVTIYLLSVLNVLVLVQRHILASHLPSFKKSEKINPEGETLCAENVASHIGNESSSDTMDMFPNIVSESYKHFFDVGMNKFTEIIRAIVTDHLKDWKVEQKLEVDFNELVLLMVGIRKAIDTDLTNTLRDLIVPNGYDMSGGIEESKSSSFDELSMISTVSSSVALTATTSESNESPSTPSSSASNTKELLNQTWDVVESPMFRVAVTESVDICFEHVLIELRRNVYTPSINNNSTRNNSMPDISPQIQLRRPPLASLLPQVKALAARLIDDKAFNQPTSPGSVIWRNISNAMLLDELCVAVFDSLTANLSE